MSEYSSKIIIIGSGPAGYTAGIYAARAGLNPILVAGHQMGGQLTMTSAIENFPGFANQISGNELMENMRQQALNAGVKIVEDNSVSPDGVIVETLNTRLDSRISTQIAEIAEKMLTGTNDELEQE